MVTFVFRCTPSGWRSRLFPFPFPGRSWRFTACAILFRSVPFNYPFRPPDVKATPTFHNSSSRKTAILVALAHVVGVRDWLTSVHHDLSGSRSTHFLLPLSVYLSTIVNRETCQGRQEIWSAWLPWSMYPLKIYIHVLIMGVYLYTYRWSTPPTWSFVSYFTIFKA